MLAVPTGIVETRTTAYGPARGRVPARPIPMIETPEKARLRDDLERTREALQEAQSQAAQATAAERKRMEAMARAALHGQQLKFENVARQFEAESRIVRDLEVSREQLFADAKLNDLTHQAGRVVRGQQSQIAYAEHEANLLAQQLNDSRNTEQAALAHATSAAAHASK